MSAEAWLAIESFGNKTDKSVTSVVTQEEWDNTRYKRGEARPATPTEVRQEEKKRAERADRVAREREFQQREEYAIASSIRDTLEMMTHDRHPLDCLTLDQWKALRAKLDGEQAEGAQGDGGTK